MSQPLPDIPAKGGPPPVGFAEAFRFWLKLGFINFGGPTGQIAIMHTELVDRKKWIGEERFLHALNFCMLLPGPEAQQLAIYIGWLLHGTRGGLAGGILFVLPGAALMMALSYIYAAHGSVPMIAAVFEGLRAVVTAIVVAAVIRIGQKALRHRLMWWIAAAAFLAIFFLHVPFPLIVAGAALAGWIGSRVAPEAFASKEGHGAASSHEVVIADHHDFEGGAPPTLARAAKVLAMGLSVWWLPLLAVIAIRGRSDTLSQEAVFFSKAAMVTFGGAYAVLSYLTQAAVERYGWLRAPQMLDGLGLAETTPGPLILVTQFVGFVGAYQHPGGLPPVAAGLLGGLVALWATFAPCFLWIFLGAPYIERLRGNRAIAASLTAITAAVVGVILNLAVWFAVHTLFASVADRSWGALHAPVPELATIRWFPLALAAGAFIGMQKFKWGILPIVGAGAALGLAKWLIGGG